MLDELNRRRALQTIAAAVGAAAGFPARLARAQAPVQMISHRYPALEYFAEKMRTAVPGVEVNTQLMPIDRADELATIALSSGASTFDIVYANNNSFLKYAKNGWFRPLDDLWEKYREQFALDDFVDSIVESYRFDGKLYIVPHTANVMLMFYRTDLFAAAGKQPPKTMEEYEALAAEFHSPARAGTVSCQKPVDASLNETHWYMNTIGDGWFDDQMRPIFNNENGVEAVETLKRITRYAQRGFTSAANDECAVALQQDLVAMGLQWATRAASMDDPNQSRVVGKIDWAVAPGGGKVRLGGDGYAISAYSTQDPDMLFRIIATSSGQENMQGAAGLMVPPRTSILDDPENVATYRHFAAAREALGPAIPFPPLPEFYEVGESITRRVQQALTGEMEVKPALDAAAQESIELLRSRGYNI